MCTNLGLIAAALLWRPLTILGFEELSSRPLDEDTRRNLDHREITEDITLINASVQVRAMSPVLDLALALDLGLAYPWPWP